MRQLVWHLQMSRWKCNGEVAVLGTRDSLKHDEQASDPSCETCVGFIRQNGGGFWRHRGQGEEDGGAEKGE